MKGIYIVVLGLLLTLRVYAQSGLEEVNKAYLQQDIVSLIRCSKTYPEQQTRIEDYLFTEFDYNNYTYEQILDFCNQASDNPSLFSGFEGIRKEKEIEILSSISELTVEQLVSYVKQFSKRRAVVDLYAKSIIEPRLDSLSYFELSYLERKSGLACVPKIGRIKKGKKDEVRTALQKELDEYCANEEVQLDKLVYMMKYRAFSYVHLAFREIAQKYSKLDVPEYPDDMLRQVNDIINSHFRVSDINGLMQQVATNYCKAINRNRDLYLRQIECRTSAGLNLRIAPLQPFGYQTNIGYFREISRMRNKLVETKENSSSVSSTVGYFTDWAGVGRALYDYAAVSEEASQEVKLRKSYLLAVMASIEETIEQKFEKTETMIRNDYKINQKTFKEYVSTKL